MIFRKAAAGELEEDSGLLALYRNVEEIDVDAEGVKGAKNFFQAKVRDWSLRVKPMFVVGVFILTKLYGFIDLFSKCNSESNLLPFKIKGKKK